MAVPDVTTKALHELISLRGRVAVVTGAGRGIGLAVARRLAEAGADVAVGDLDEETARGGAEELLAFGVRSFGTTLDVSAEPSVRQLADRTESELGPIYIWVNNAGIYPSTPVLDMDVSQWDRVLDVNLTGTFLGAQEAARRMVATGVGGAIINITSTAGFRAAGPGVAHYVASKHAVRGLTKSLAVELGPYGIRVLSGRANARRDPGYRRGPSCFRGGGPR